MSESDRRSQYATTRERHPFHISGFYVIKSAYFSICKNEILLYIHPFYIKKYSTFFFPYSHISLIQVIIALRMSEARFVVGVFYAPTSDSEKNMTEKKKTH